MNAHSVFSLPFTLLRYHQADSFVYLASSSSSFLPASSSTSSLILLSCYSEWSWVRGMSLCKCLTRESLKRGPSGCFVCALLFRMLVVLNHLPVPRLVCFIFSTRSYGLREEAQFSTAGAAEGLGIFTQVFNAILITPWHIKYRFFLLLERFPSPYIITLETGADWGRTGCFSVTSNNDFLLLPSCLIWACLLVAKWEMMEKSCRWLAERCKLCTPRNIWNKR